MPLRAPEGRRATLARMKAARLALLAIACTVPLLASAQWVWIGKDGRKVFSDQAPPPDITPDKIVKGPRGQQVVPVNVAPTATPAADTAAALPKPAGKDKTLEDKKKQLAADEAKKKQDEDAKYAALKADNCSRARQAKANLDSGVRMTTVDAKGERQYLDDNARAAEAKRLQEVMARDCAQ